MSTFRVFYEAVGVNSCLHKSKSRRRNKGCLMDNFGNRRIRSNTLVFIRTYNFVAERPFLFAEFELENVLNGMNYTKFDHKLRCVLPCIIQ